MIVKRKILSFLLLLFLISLIYFFFKFVFVKRIEKQTVSTVKTTEVIEKSTSPASTTTNNVDDSVEQQNNATATTVKAINASTENEQPIAKEDIVPINSDTPKQTTRIRTTASRKSVKKLKARIHSDTRKTVAETTIDSSPVVLETIPQTEAPATKAQTEPVNLESLLFDNSGSTTAKSVIHNEPDIILNRVSVETPALNSNSLKPIESTKATGAEADANALASSASTSTVASIPTTAIDVNAQGTSSTTRDINTSASSTSTSDVNTPASPTSELNAPASSSTSELVHVLSDKPADSENPSLTTTSATSNVPENITLSGKDQSLCGSSGTVKCGVFDLTGDADMKYRVFYAYHHEGNMQRIMRDLESKPRAGFRLRSVFRAINTETATKKADGAQFECYTKTLYAPGTIDRVPFEVLDEFLEKTRKSGFIGAYNCFSGQTDAPWTDDDFYLIVPLAEAARSMKLVNADSVDYSQSDFAITSIKTVYNQEQIKTFFWQSYRYTIRAREISNLFKKSGLQALSIDFFNSDNIVQNRERHHEFEIFNRFKLLNPEVKQIAYDGLNVFFRYNGSKPDIIDILDGIKANGSLAEFNRQFGYGIGFASVNFSLLLIGSQEKLNEFKKYN